MRKGPKKQTLRQIFTKIKHAQAQESRSKELVSRRQEDLIKGVGRRLKNDDVFMNILGEVGLASLAANGHVPVKLTSEDIRRWGWSRDGSRKEMARLAQLLGAKMDEFHERDYDLFRMCIA